MRENNDDQSGNVFYFVTAGSHSNSICECERGAVFIAIYTKITLMDPGNTFHWWTEKIFQVIRCNKNGYFINRLRKFWGSRSKMFIVTAFYLSASRRKISASTSDLIIWKKSYGCYKKALSLKTNIFCSGFKELKINSKKKKQKKWVMFVKNIVTTENPSSFWS